MGLGRHISMGLVISMMALVSLVVARNAAAEDGTTPSPKAMPLLLTPTSQFQPPLPHLEITPVSPDTHGLGQVPDSLGSAKDIRGDVAAISPTPLLTATVSPTDIPTIEPTFGESAADQAEVQVVTQEPDAAPQAVAGVQTYFWHQSFIRPVRMIRSNSGICFLTQVRGRFRGAGEKVTIVNRDGYWWLEGESKQAGVAAQATCVPFSAIRHSHTLRYSVKPAFVWARANECPPILPCDSWAQHQVPLGSPSDFCYLTGMGGHFRGGGEWVAIVNRNGTLVLVVETIVDGGYIRAEAGCISLIRNPNQRVSAPRIWERGSGPVSLVGTDAAFCGLIGVQGRYQSERDRVEIFTTGNSRYLYGYTDSDKANLARAHCYYYDQLPRVPSPTPAPAPPRLFRVRLPIMSR
jgi:hypothetical protein